MSTSSRPSSTLASGVIFIPPPSETPLPIDTSAPAVSMTLPSRVILYLMGRSLVSSIMSAMM